MGDAGGFGESFRSHRWWRDESFGNPATVFATLSYKLWGPDDTSTPQRSMYHK
jgi:hypothetical protein